jgi:hypothetical protein
MTRHRRGDEAAAGELGADLVANPLTVERVGKRPADALVVEGW